MTLLQWSDSYSVGITVFDDEHKSLIKMMNELYQHILNGTATDKAVQEVLQKLVAYTKEHFLHEEVVLEKYQFPKLAEHKHQHQALCDEIQHYVGLLGANGISLDVARFLLEWVLQHILKDDMQYRDYLISKGLT